MDTEKLSSAEILEAKIGEKGMRTLGKVCGMLYSREKGSMAIRDQSLVDPALEIVQQKIREVRQKQGEPPIEFLVIDFRKKGSRVWEEELKEKLGDPTAYSGFNEGYNIKKFGEDFMKKVKKNKENLRLIFVDPFSDSDRCAGLNRMNLYVKYGMSTLTIVSDMEWRKWPHYVQKLAGEYSGWSYYLDYDPNEN